MNKIISYTTDVSLTAKIVEHFSDAINKHIKGWESEALHINNFLSNGLPKNVNAVATLGILRGSGHLLKEAAKKNIDRYYIDHAYFSPLLSKFFQGFITLFCEKNFSHLKPDTSLT